MKYHKCLPYNYYKFTNAVLFIHSACVAVALLLPCALCDRITLPHQSIDRTSTQISTKKGIKMVQEGVVDREIKEDQGIKIHVVQEIETIKKTEKEAETEIVEIATKIGLRIKTAREKENEIKKNVVAATRTEVGKEIAVAIKTFIKKKKLLKENHKKNIGQSRGG